MNNKFSAKDVKGAAENIKKHATNINSILADVSKQMNTVKNSWKSDSQEQYIRNFNSFKKNFEEFYNAVSAFGKRLNEVAQIYENLESNIKKAASNLQN